MIPQKIHYCWFGENQKTELVKKCVESWHEYCPDYEIIEWNESNYDIEKSKFMKEAYSAKKWAYVSDAARLDIVYTQGGVYLDTDVKLTAPIDSLLNDDFFCFFETGRRINTGLGFGAVKGSEIVKEMLKQYEIKGFYIDGKMDCVPCSKRNTDALLKVCNKINLNGRTQKYGGCSVYSAEDYRYYAEHLYMDSWNECEKSGKSFKPSKIKSILRNEKNFLFIERVFGKKMLSVYEFLVYDLIEFGIFYYIKRKLRN